MAPPQIFTLCGGVNLLCSPPAHPRSPLHMQQTKKADVGFGQRWRGDHVGSNLTVLSCKEHAKQVCKVSAKMFGDEGGPGEHTFGNCVDDLPRRNVPDGGG